jgi:HAD superfamily hydrolase (TIGR01509 family)
MTWPQRVRGVIFDVDGTLLHSNDAHARAWVRAFAAGGHAITFDQVRPLIGMGGDKVIPLLTGLDADGPAGQLIGDRRHVIFMRDFLPLLSPEPGARNLVQLARDRGLAVAVASSATSGELAGLLRSADVADLFDTVVSKDDAGKSKPDPDPIHAALRRLAVPAAEAIMIGDTPYDIESARRAGVATIAVRCGGWSSQDLADAIAVYDNPQDLANDFDASPLGKWRAA